MMTRPESARPRRTLPRCAYVFPTLGSAPPPGTLQLLNVRDVLRFATINGAKHLGLDHKTGSLTPGKEADIIVLDGTHINVFPVNHVPGAVVQMMERSNVETVIVTIGRGVRGRHRGRCKPAPLGSPMVLASPVLHSRRYTRA